MEARGTHRRRARSAAAGLVVLALAWVALPSVPGHAATPRLAPGAPVATGLDGRVTLRWSPPASGSSVDAYRVRVVPSGRVVGVPAVTPSATIGSLANGTTYSFTVSAHTASGWSPPSAPSAGVVPTRPNIVLILTDDQRWDSLDQLPATNAGSWRRFTRSFVVEPMCCPSRASTLTGRIPTHTHVDTLLTGALLDERRTFATLLHHAGYHTVFAGKYLNGYPFGRGAYTPPGWDKFFAFTGGANYFEYKLVENGRVVTHGVTAADYSTDVLRDDVLAAARAASRAQPLLVELAPNAPHRAGLLDPVPAPRHLGVCADRVFPEPPNFNARDAVSEPAWMAGEQPKPEETVIRMRRATCETLRAVDEAVSAILSELEHEGRLANTYVVLTSDNGYQFGEHRLLEKGDLYEESVRVPLLVRGPGVVAGDAARLTSNVDLAPTFLDWARVAPPTGFFDGTSFAASARGAVVAGPTAVLLRGCRTGRTASGASGPCGGHATNMGKNWGLRTARYEYVEYPKGYRQLFDVVADPWELRNLAPDPAYATVMAALHRQMVAMGGGG